MSVTLDQIKTEAVKFVFHDTIFTIHDRIELEKIGYGENLELARDLDAIALGKMDNRNVRQMKLYGWLKKRAEGRNDIETA